MKAPWWTIIYKQAATIRQQARDLRRLQRSYRDAVDANHSLQAVCEGWQTRCVVLLEMVPDQQTAHAMLRTLGEMDQLPTRPQGPRSAP